MGLAATSFSRATALMARVWRLQTILDSTRSRSHSRRWRRLRPESLRPGRAILARDFSGRYNLVANGQWSGALVLEIDAAGAVTGLFRSDRNGSAYPVTGKVSAEVPQKIEFSIQFPRTANFTRAFSGARGKMRSRVRFQCSTARTASSRSAREHRLVPRSTSGVRLSVPDKVSRRVVNVEAGSDRYTFDGLARSEAELTEALSKAVKNDPATERLAACSRCRTF